MTYPFRHQISTQFFKATIKLLNRKTHAKAMTLFYFFPLHSFQCLLNIIKLINSALFNHVRISPVEFFVCVRFVISCSHFSFLTVIITVSPRYCYTVSTSLDYIIYTLLHYNNKSLYWPTSYIIPFYCFLAVFFTRFSVSGQ